MAASRGGYTAVCSMPNLNPVPDSLENIKIQEEIIQKDAVIDVFPFASITRSQKGEELSDLSSAPTTVKDADVKDDPDALTYGPDCYTDNAPMDDKDGTIDTEINSKEESAFFGAMFY